MSHESFLSSSSSLISISISLPSCPFQFFIQLCLRNGLLSSLLPPLPSYPIQVALHLHLLPTLMYPCQSLSFSPPSHPSSSDLSCIYSPHYRHCILPVIIDRMGMNLVPRCRMLRWKGNQQEEMEEQNECTFWISSKRNEYEIIQRLFVESECSPLLSIQWPFQKTRMVLE